MISPRGRLYVPTRSVWVGLLLVFRGGRCAGPVPRPCSKKPCMLPFILLGRPTTIMWTGPGSSAGGQEASHSCCPSQQPARKGICDRDPSRPASVQVNFKCMSSPGKVSTTAQSTRRLRRNDTSLLF